MMLRLVLLRFTENLQPTFCCIMTPPRFGKFIVPVVLVRRIDDAGHEYIVQFFEFIFCVDEFCLELLELLILQLAQEARRG